jgi:hypothetical protein
MQRAAGGGNLWGPKPVKNRGAVAQPRVADRPRPATSADARHRGGKRRDAGGGTGVDTPQSPPGLAAGRASPHGGRRCSPAARRRGGRAGGRLALALALGNSSTAFPTVGGHDQARGRAGGRRRRRSPMPRGHDGARGQVCQAGGTETAAPPRTWEPLTLGSP